MRPAWVFDVLAPGMELQRLPCPSQDDQNDKIVTESDPVSGLASWVRRGCHLLACRAAIPVHSGEEADPTITNNNNNNPSPSNTRIVLPTSTHAFSARAHFRADEDSGQKKDEDESVNGNGGSDVNTCVMELQQLHTTSSPTEKVDQDPSFLVGLSAEHLPDATESVEQFGVRTLSTPLLWEEPQSFFFECRRGGLFLWSHDAGHYGTRVADRCLASVSDAFARGEDHTTNGSAGSPVLPAEMVVARARVRLSWTSSASASAVAAVSSNSAINTLGADEDAHVLSVQLLEGQRGASAPIRGEMRIPRSVLPSLDGLVPTVTFLTEHCQACIVPV